MKLFELINSNRQLFVQQLEDNKRALQSARSRVGVIKILDQIFPNINFKYFGNSTGAANYDKDTKTITVYNNDGLFTRSVVNGNWDKFVDTLTNLLTHENIHQQQDTRSDHHRKPLPVPDKKIKKELTTEWMNLIDLYHEYQDQGDQNNASLVHKKITQLRKKAAKSGVVLDGTHKDYLSDPTEIVAYAETIAANINQRRNRDESIRMLQTDPDKLHIPELDNYLTTFTNTDAPLKRLYKLIYQYLQAAKTTTNPMQLSK